MNQFLVRLPYSDILTLISLPLDVEAGIKRSKGLYKLILAWCHSAKLITFWFTSYVCRTTNMTNNAFGKHSVLRWIGLWNITFVFDGKLSELLSHIYIITSSIGLCLAVPTLRLERFGALTWVRWVHRHFVAWIYMGCSPSRAAGISMKDFQYAFFEAVFSTVLTDLR